MERQQDRDTHSSTEHIRILWSGAPSLCPPLPQEPWGGAANTTSTTSTTSTTLHLLCHPEGTRPRALQEGEQLVPGQAPSAGCVKPIRNSISRLPVAKGSAAPCAGSARGRGDWCSWAHVMDPSLSSCPKMGSSSHEQAAVPHRAADKQKTDSISTK